MEEANKETDEIKKKINAVRSVQSLEQRETDDNMEKNDKIVEMETAIAEYKVRKIFFCFMIGLALPDRRSFFTEEQVVFLQFYISPPSSVALPSGNE